MYRNRPFSNDFLRKEGDAKKYIGLAETSFKVRYANSKLSFHNEKYRDSTDLSKHFWNLSDTHKTFHVTSSELGPTQLCNEKVQPLNGWKYFLGAVKIIASFCTFSVQPNRHVKLCTALVFTGEQREIIRDISEAQNSYICRPSSHQQEV